MTAKPLGVGLLGLGTVGSAVGRAFADRQKRIDAAAGRTVRLVGAAVRDVQDVATKYFPPASFSLVTVGEIK